MTQDPKMTPKKPFLLRAMRDWIVSNSMTPYLVVNAAEDVCGVQVPWTHVKNGQIVLNIGPQATKFLEISNYAVSFEASFGGKAMSIYIPISHVDAIYAKENGDGMPFNRDEDIHEPPPPPPGKPKLTVVKNLTIVKDE
jgi:stringent starvation protein B